MALGCHGIDVMHGYQTDLTDKQLQVIKNMPGLQKNQKIYIVKICVMWRMLPQYFCSVSGSLKRLTILLYFTDCCAIASLAS